VSGNKSIVYAFLRIGKSGKSTQFAVCVENIAPSGEYLVSVSLMANIPNQFVVWRVV
jgi:hypothetical protein